MLQYEKKSKIITVTSRRPRGTVRFSEKVPDEITFGIFREVRYFTKIRYFSVPYFFRTTSPVVSILQKIVFSQSQSTYHGNQTVTTSMLTGAIGIISWCFYDNSRILIVPTNVTAGYHLTVLSQLP